MTFCVGLIPFELRSGQNVYFLAHTALSLGFRKSEKGNKMFAFRHRRDVSGDAGGLETTDHYSIVLTPSCLCEEPYCF